MNGFPWGEWCGRDLDGPAVRAAYGGTLKPALVATQSGSV
jgi:hypothetical protein